MESITECSNEDESIDENSSLLAVRREAISNFLSNDVESTAPSSHRDSHREETLHSTRMLVL